MSTFSFGKIAEDQAIVYLLQHHLRFVARNYYCRSGEIDLIMRDPLTAATVFVEVKSGSSDDPLNNFTPRKLKRLLRAINSYQLARGESYTNSRIDFVGVSQQQIEWIPDIELPLSLPR